MPDQVSRHIGGGTCSFFWPASAAANLVVSPSNATPYANGVSGPVFLVAGFLTGNSANATGTTGNVSIYAGNVGTANTLIYTLAGNSGANAPTSIAFPLGSNAGNITVQVGANAAQGWISFFSGGAGGQPG